jgi:hypothetical protein
VNLTILVQNLYEDLMRLHLFTQVGSGAVGEIF